MNTGGKSEPKDNPQTAKKNDVINETKIAVIISEPIVTPEMPVTASAEKAPVSIAKNNSVAGRTAAALANAKKETNVVISESEQKENAKRQKKAEKREAKFAKKLNRGTDSQLIFLVILSLFPIFALLAMYIKDGHQVTLNFWVDLLLHLTVIGYIIFALLVVFDIVNLA